MRAAARKNDVQFGPLEKGLTARRGGWRAIVAVGHKILRIAFAMLRDRKPYKDPDLDYDQLLAQPNQARWVRALRKAKLLPAVAAVPARPTTRHTPIRAGRESGVEGVSALLDVGGSSLQEHEPGRRARGAGS